MKLAYICSPYKSDRQQGVKYNIWKACYISKEAYKIGLIPICVHTFLEETTGLNEQKGDRKELLRIGREIVKMCQYIIINKDKPISEGMKEEIRTARSYGLTELYWKDGQIRSYSYIKGGD